MARRKSGCGIWILFWIILLLVLIIILLQNANNFKQKDVRNKLNQLKNYISHSIDNKHTSVTNESNSSQHIASTTKKENSSIEHRSTEIYFVKYIESSDKLKLIKVNRKFIASDTPLVDSINLLLAGPSRKEGKNKIITLFPANTKLLNAEVKGNIAYLNFNSEIETGVGPSMLQARLYQIVYTATQFPNVKGVIILINNKQKKSFSAEKISLSHPLTRLDTTPIF